MHSVSFCKLVTFSSESSECAGRLNINYYAYNLLSDTMDTGTFAQIYLDAIRPYERTGSFHFVDTENSAGTPVEGIRFMPAFGHTDGHCAIEMKSDDKRLVFTGDAWVSTVSNSIHINRLIRSLRDEIKNNN